MKTNVTLSGVEGLLIGKGFDFAQPDKKNKPKATTFENECHPERSRRLAYREGLRLRSAGQKKINPTGF
ncbi:hypothetical protein D0817_14175 [Flavobacterium cupreum]|uniref:Uncharacterized protein n=1 Tax=Flavobacterium cupreum TaxID=2133766 RepID=A0A434A633_9FLAO|nr:hypothetical protein D0817_14175 [Flavobacterium cupreum]